MVIVTILNMSLRGWFKRGEFPLHMGGYPLGGWGEDSRGRMNRWFMILKIRQPHPLALPGVGPLGVCSQSAACKS